MKQRTGRFGRSSRLLKPKDFVRVSRNGVRTADREFVLLLADSSQTQRTQRKDVLAASPRLGLSMSRRVGNAVERNRIKRFVREWFRVARHRLPLGLDLVIIGRPGSASIVNSRLNIQLDGLLASCQRRMASKERRRGGETLVSRQHG